MTECRHCDRTATLFLCSGCTNELRDNLRYLARGRRLPDGTYAAGWIDHLRDAALGQTKLGEPGRRNPRYRDHLDGESLLASQIELLPGELWETVEGPARAGEKWPLRIPLDTDIDLNRARHDRERHALQHALGTARINLRASEQVEYTHSVLVEWVRDICETRGVQTPVGDSIMLALWMADNVSAIAADEGAAVCFREIAQIIRDIDRIINRPESLHYCGPCPAQRAEGDQCNTGLHAKRGSSTVQCWKCRTVHDIDELIQRGLSCVDELLYSAEEIRETFTAIGRPIPDRTWRQWRAEDKLIVRGFRDGKPAYWVNDVKQLLAAKPQKEPTGAAARKCG